MTKAQEKEIELLEKQRQDLRSELTGIEIRKRSLEGWLERVEKELNYCKKY
ncbi:MAG: hypothetical protein GY928_33560 [Colwellia sp.]|nr:hypothetical protein [Colwellia sp.]